MNNAEKPFRTKALSIKNSFINYRGKTTDTKEYFTEVIAEFLCDNITDYINGIDCITRKSSYKTEGHDGKYGPDSNRDEEKIAMQFFIQSRDYGASRLIGKIVDYQTPLKSSADDEAGKIDILEIFRLLHTFATILLLTVICCFVKLMVKRYYTLAISLKCCYRLSQNRCSHILLLFNGRV